MPINKDKKYKQYHTLYDEHGNLRDPKTLWIVHSQKDGKPVEEFRLRADGCIGDRNLPPNKREPYIKNAKSGLGKGECYGFKKKKPGGIGSRCGITLTKEMARLEQRRKAKKIKRWHRLGALVYLGKANEKQHLEYKDVTTWILAHLNKHELDQQYVRVKARNRSLDGMKG